jgi:diadenosine tetraphosphate (Ap4A) HIT family hydrolase
MVETHPMAGTVSSGKLPDKIGPDGWPEDYAERKAGKGCWLCGALGKGDNHHRVSVFAGDYGEFYIERRTTLPGYGTVVWNRGHIVEPTQLSDEDSAGYWREVVQAARAVEQHFKPIKLNILSYGNLTPHLHTYIMPRYPNDPAAGRPMPLEKAYSIEPIAEEELKRQAAALRELILAQRK